MHENICSTLHEGRKYTKYHSLNHIWTLLQTTVYMYKYSKVHEIRVHYQKGKL